MKTFILIVLGLALVIVAYVLVVLGAVHSGQKLHDERALGTLSANIERQIWLAATDVWSGNKELAVQRLSWVLTQTPNYPQIASTHQAALVTSTPTVTPTPVTPTPTVTPTATPNPDIEFEQAVVDYQSGDWETSIAKLHNLQVTHPDYRTNEVQQMLYDSYLSIGRDLLETDRIEEALFYLGEAEVLGPIPQDIEESRDKASRYLRALSYMGVDWERAIEELEILTYGSVGYRDVFDLLIESHVTFGDTWAAVEEWCPAAAQYAEAVRLYYDAAVEEKRLEASLACQSATPTPIPGVITDTVTVGPIAGLTVGKLAYTIFNPTNYLYDLMVVSAAEPVPVRYYSHVGQPSWRSDGSQLLFKSWGEDGLITMPAGGGSPTYVLGIPASYPSFSPDGSRIAFATQYYSGDWQVYIAPVDGSSAPQYSANGQAPIWGPGGYIAYNGCSADGASCGIWVNNPDDGEIPVQLTASSLDIPMSWSSDGANIAYMSTYGGGWDIYNVHVSGAVTLLTDNPSVDALPAWAPDGSGLAFISDRDGSWGIYLMRPDGTEQRKIIELGDQHHNWTSERLSWGW